MPGQAINCKGAWVRSVCNKVRSSGHQNPGGEQSDHYSYEGVIRLQADPVRGADSDRGMEFLKHVYFLSITYLEFLNFSSPLRGFLVSARASRTAAALNHLKSGSFSERGVPNLA